MERWDKVIIYTTATERFLGAGQFTDKDNRWSSYVLKNALGIVLLRTKKDGHTVVDNIPISFIPIKENTQLTLSQNEADSGR